MMLRRRRRDYIRRNLISRDSSYPLEVYNDNQVFRKFRFHGQAILDLTDSVGNDLQYLLPRKGSLTPSLQVLLTLRFYATGEFQDVTGDLIGVGQSTACRTITRVTRVLCEHVAEWITCHHRGKLTKRNRNSSECEDSQK